MMKLSHRAVLAAATLAIVGATGACSKKDDAASTPPPATTPIAPDTSAVKVTDVDVGHSVGADKKMTNKADTFAAKDTVFASVHTTGGGAAKLGARWTFQDGQIVDERSDSVVPAGDAYTEFHILKPTGLPAGKYTVHILLNGTEVSTKDFTVK